MRALLSDIRLSVNWLPFPDINADIVICTGDIPRPAAAFEWVVVSHFAPTRLSISGAFKHPPIISSFVSDLTTESKIGSLHFGCTAIPMEVLIIK